MKETKTIRRSDNWETGISRYYGGGGGIDGFPETSQEHPNTFYSEKGFRRPSIRPRGQFITSLLHGEDKLHHIAIFLTSSGTWDLSGHDGGTTETPLEHCGSMVLRGIRGLTLRTPSCLKKFTPSMYFSFQFRSPERWDWNFSINRQGSWDLSASLGIHLRGPCLSNSRFDILVWEILWGVLMERFNGEF